MHPHNFTVNLSFTDAFKDFIDIKIYLQALRKLSDTNCAKHSLSLPRLHNYFNVSISLDQLLQFVVEAPTLIDLIHYSESSNRILSQLNLVKIC